MLSSEADMSNEEVTDEDVDRVLANHFPGVEFTAMTNRATPARQRHSPVAP